MGVNDLRLGAGPGKENLRLTSSYHTPVPSISLKVITIYGFSRSTTRFNHKTNHGRGRGQVQPQGQGQKYDQIILTYLSFIR